MAEIVYNLTPEEPVVKRNVDQRPILKGVLALLITGAGAFALAATLTATLFFSDDLCQDNMQLFGILPVFIATLITEMALMSGSVLVWVLFAARHRGAVWHVVAMSFLWAVLLPPLGYVSYWITTTVTGNLVLALLLTAFELTLVVAIVCIIWRYQSTRTDRNEYVVIWSSP